MTDTLTVGAISREARTRMGSSTSSEKNLLETRTHSMSSTEIDSKAGLDWTATLSPMERSCIDLMNIEPCVKKAVANLESLKETLTLKMEQEAFAPPKQARPSSVRLKSVDSEESDLSVEGFQTGIILEKYRRAVLSKKVPYHRAVKNSYSLPMWQNLIEALANTHL